MNIRGSLLSSCSARYPRPNAPHVTPSTDTHVLFTRQESKYRQAIAASISTYPSISPSLSAPSCASQGSLWDYLTRHRLKPVRIPLLQGLDGSRLPDDLTGLIASYCCTRGAEAVMPSPVFARLAEVEGVGSELRPSPRGVFTFGKRVRTVRIGHTSYRLPFTSVTRNYAHRYPEDLVNVCDTRHPDVLLRHAGGLGGQGRAAWCYGGRGDFLLPQRIARQLPPGGGLWAFFADDTGRSSRPIRAGTLASLLSWRPTYALRKGLPATLHNMSPADAMPHMPLVYAPMYRLGCASADEREGVRVVCDDHVLRGVRYDALRLEHVAGSTSFVSVEGDIVRTQLEKRWVHPFLTYAYFPFSARGVGGSVLISVPESKGDDPVEVGRQVRRIASNAHYSRLFLAVVLGAAVESLPVSYFVRSNFTAAYREGLARNDSGVDIECEQLHLMTCGDKAVSFEMAVTCYCDLSAEHQARVSALLSYSPVLVSGGHAGLTRIDAKGRGEGHALLGVVCADSGDLLTAMATSSQLNWLLALAALSRRVEHDRAHAQGADGFAVRSAVIEDLLWATLEAMRTWGAWARAACEYLTSFVCPGGFEVSPSAEVRGEVRAARELGSEGEERQPADLVGVGVAAVVKRQTYRDCIRHDLLRALGAGRVEGCCSASCVRRVALTGTFVVHYGRVYVLLERVRESSDEKHCQPRSTRD